MNDDILDFNNIISLRNQLAVATTKQLVDIYQDEASYLAFLDAFVFLSEYDSGFLLSSDEFLDKVLTVVSVHRFDMKYPEIQDTINDIITYVNGVKCYSDDLKKLLMNGYLAYQEDVRNANFSSTDAFLTSLSYDAVVFTALREGRPEAICDDNYFLMSFEYIMNCCPEFFQNPNVCRDAQSVLDRVSSHVKLFDSRKKYIKSTKEKFQMITKKEE